MRDDDVVIVGAGILCPVGLTAAEAAAAVRAGVMRFAVSSWLDQYYQPMTLAGVSDDALPELDETLAETVGITLRESRLLRLASLPILEALEPLKGSKETIGLTLALPDRETMVPLVPERLLERLARQTSGVFSIKQSEASFRGRAGGLAALDAACHRIRSGQARWMLGGGVDSYLSVSVLARLDQEKRIKSDRVLDGFIPGEGAAFLLFTSRRTAKEKRLLPLARLTPVVQGMELGHLYSNEPYRGEGLAETLSKFLAAGHCKAPIQEVFSSMNGENYWAKEWGVSYLRNRNAFAPEHRLCHPADCYGDIGAACGPTMVALAALGIAEGYRMSPALVYASSDLGARAVVTVHSKTEA